MYNGLPVGLGEDDLASMGLFGENAATSCTWHVEPRERANRVAYGFRLQMLKGSNVSPRVRLAGRSELVALEDGWGSGLRARGGRADDPALKDRSRGASSAGLIGMETWGRSLSDRALPEIRP
jgi:hypothetical protein